jgi:FixH
MNNITPSKPTPWFKQFWPWFLISLPGTVVIASMITLSIAIDSAPIITDRDIGKFARENQNPENRMSEPSLPKQ